MKTLACVTIITWQIIFLTNCLGSFTVLEKNFGVVPALLLLAKNVLLTFQIKSNKKFDILNDHNEFVIAIF